MCGKRLKDFNWFNTNHRFSKNQCSLSIFNENIPFTEFKGHQTTSSNIIFSKWPLRGTKPNLHHWEENDQYDKGTWTPVIWKIAESTGKNEPERTSIVFRHCYCLEKRISLSKVWIRTNDCKLKWQRFQLNVNVRFLTIKMKWVTLGVRD